MKLSKFLLILLILLLLPFAFKSKAQVAGKIQPMVVEKKVNEVTVLKPQEEPTSFYIFSRSKPSKVL